MQSREQWGSRLGFVLAAAGSAVGLGNIWKFPYMTGQNGGGAFLIIYLVLVFTIGISVMLAEFAIGRAAQRNPVGAFAILKGKMWPLVGAMGVLAGFIILSFYSVVAGWTLAYIGEMAQGNLAGDAAELGKTFGAFISDPVDPILYHALFMILTVAVVLGGVSGGIERACKILMPMLFVLLIVLIGRAVTLPGAEKGLEFFLSPDFSKVTADTFNGALSQAFFSLSIGMGAMITYGSYLSKKENIAKSALWVSTLDSSVAVLAGLLILPAVFAFGFDPAAGPALTFITLPAVFAQMPGGEFFGILFFLLLSVAALTSAVSLLQPIVAYFVDEKGWNFKATAVVFGLIIFALGVPSSLAQGIWSDFHIFGKDFLTFMDYITANIMLPVGGILISVFVGWSVAGKMQDEVTNEGEKTFPFMGVWLFICRFVAPVAIGWILISGL
ncbi:sodium-dependent transporter [Terasakiella sp. A23]|uniref:sodium-dependent transporter n=1 Tax=Terasakiella sp. FCG-A23 TaxID=3080561 RepID=UPI002953B7A5|nr:sodium-dependent transporter [Terasakiella sp. A23]MDV7339200.1 sodium-dependent transporter [Terasakiella sp. A23]